MVYTDKPTEINLDCGHKVADHYHGTHACYSLDLCRCAPCTRARREYEAWRQTQESNRVPADATRRKIEKLMRQGMGLKRIAKVSGLSHGALSKVVYGMHSRAPSLRVNRKTEETILALRLDLADGAKVSRTEADQIIGELLNRGWSKTAIAHALGQGGPGLQLVGKTIMAGTLRRLRYLLWDPVPPRWDSWGGLRQLPDSAWSVVVPSTRGVPEDRYLSSRRRAWAGGVIEPTPYQPTPYQPKERRDPKYREWWIQTGREGLQKALLEARERDARYARFAHLR